MSLTRRKKRVKEKYAKQLFDCVVKYVFETRGKDSKERESIFKKHYQEWREICVKGNSAEKGVIVFDFDAFPRMVEKKYIEVFKVIFKDAGFIEINAERLKKHVYV